MIQQKRSPLLIATLFTLLILSPVSAHGEETAETPTKIVQSEIASSEAAASLVPGMMVIRRDDIGTASLVVNTIEIMNIRSAAGGFTPAQRAEIAQQRLSRYFQQGKSARDIVPGLEKNQVVIRLDQDILVTVDNATAQKSGMTTRELAYQWTNRIRNATGVERLNRDPNLVASRGFSPLLDQLRATGEIVKGFASWYGPGFHGRRCANGERFNMHGLTAAHRTLPLGSMVKVTNAWTGKSAVVRINDRGPFIGGRVIDLSRGAAQAVGMLSSGTAPVIVEVLTKQP